MSQPMLIMTTYERQAADYYASLLDEGFHRREAARRTQMRFHRLSREFRFHLFAR